MEPLMHNDYRQQPITSDEAYRAYHEFLEHVEEMISLQEDVVSQARAQARAAELARARTALWRLLTKRQGVVDALAAYARDQNASRTA